MGLGAPASTIADTTLRDEAVDMRIPLKITPEGMEDTDKTGSKAFGFVVFVEHTEDDTADSGEEASKEGTVSKEECAEFFYDGEDTVAVFHVQNLKGHGGSTVNGVFCTAGGAETAVAAERDKFSFPYLSQPNMTPPQEGSPQLSMRSTFQVTDWRGWRI